MSEEWRQRKQTHTKKRTKEVKERDRQNAKYNHTIGKVRTHLPDQTCTL